MQNEKARQEEIVNKIIDNASKLPLEGQQTLLTVAKAMQYTRNCMLQQEDKTQA